MKHGTEWTEPGKGATAAQLWQATYTASMEYNREITTEALNNLLYLKEYRHLSPDHGTNLRLTGEPLTAEDVQRIAECK